MKNSLKDYEIQTERLLLKPFQMKDAARIQLLAGDARVSKYTLNIPHPYLDGMAEIFIEKQLQQMQDEKGLCLGIYDGYELIGVVSLINIEAGTAELGYWLGYNYWGKGYMSEAVAGLLNLCQLKLNLSKLHARHHRDNPASGSVLTKCGFEFQEHNQTPCGKPVSIYFYEFI